MVEDVKEGEKNVNVEGQDNVICRNIVVFKNSIQKGNTECEAECTNDCEYYHNYFLLPAW